MSEQHAAAEIHSFMQIIQEKYNVPPCRDLAAYLAILETSGLVSAEQADKIRNHYEN